MIKFFHLLFCLVLAYGCYQKSLPIESNLNLIYDFMKDEGHRAIDYRKKGGSIDTVIYQGTIQYPNDRIKQSFNQNHKIIDPQSDIISYNFDTFRHYENLGLKCIPNYEEEFLAVTTMFLNRETSIKNSQTILFFSNSNNEDLKELEYCPEYFKKISNQMYYFDLNKLLKENHR